MDGVNYIADHTKKEEESTKVSKLVTLLLAICPNCEHACLSVCVCVYE